jgi:hypothetical protein
MISLFHVLITNVLEMDASVEDAWAEHSFGNAPWSPVMEKRICVRHLHFLISVIVFHAIVPINFDLEDHSNVGPVAEQGHPSRVVLHFPQFLPAVEIHSCCIPIEASALLLMIARSSKSSTCLMAVRHDGIRSFHFASMEVRVIIWSRSVPVPEGPIALFG